MAHVFVIGLGSNLGVREHNLSVAVEDVARLALPLAVRLEALSCVYETAAIGPPQPAYLNAALRLSACCTPEVLLDALHAIEAAHGRTRDVHWGPRSLDLDILWASEGRQTERLTIPHSQLLLRAFALAPMLEVAPELAVDYAAALRRLGGPPVVRGSLRYDLTSGSCVFAAFA